MNLASFQQSISGFGTDGQGNSEIILTLDALTYKLKDPNLPGYSNNSTIDISDENQDILNMLLDKIEHPSTDDSVDLNNDNDTTSSTSNFVDAPYNNDEEVSLQSDFSSPLQLPEFSELIQDKPIEELPDMAEQLRKQKATESDLDVVDKVDDISTKDQVGNTSTINNHMWR